MYAEDVYREQRADETMDVVDESQGSVSTGGLGEEDDLDALAYQVARGLVRCRRNRRKEEVVEAK